MHLSFDTREGGRGGEEIDKTHCFGGEYLAMKEETITLGSGKEASSISEIGRLLILYGEIGNPSVHDGFGPSCFGMGSSSRFAFATLHA